MPIASATEVAENTPPFTSPFGDKSQPAVRRVTDTRAFLDDAVGPPRWFMSFHPWDLVVFVFLTAVLVLVFAAGLCQPELRREESELERTGQWN